MKDCCEHGHALNDKIIGLLHLRKGNYYNGPLTHWTPCEQEQWEYYSKANDAYTLGVTDSMNASVCIPVVRGRVSNRTNNACLFELAAGCHEQALCINGRNDRVVSD